ncbi:MAG: hypothetical protein K0R61_50 [Microvirga sp.]|jgi:hypothetical protein|nr:hypothetical protein [Microvirga sp.]MDF2969600.1 hypothetical protein [Microvirga sp.]
MMALWTAFKGSKVFVYLAIAGAVLAAIAVAVARVFSAGKAVEQAKQMRREGEMRNKADEAERMVDRAGDGELDELRRKWTRPGPQ